MLGENMDRPTDLVICWTKDGAATGGTGQAIRMANHYGVPVLNLFNTTYEGVVQYLTRMK
jgi:SpoU rRNA methylase family enzyme